MGPFTLSLLMDLKHILHSVCLCLPIAVYSTSGQHRLRGFIYYPLPGAGDAGVHKADMRKVQQLPRSCLLAI